MELIERLKEELLDLWTRGMNAETEVAKNEYFAQYRVVYEIYRKQRCYINNLMNRQVA